jgi:hypothetical protein
MDFERLGEGEQYERWSLGAKPLEQQAQGARPQREIMLGKDQVCKAVGMST